MNIPLVARGLAVAAVLVVTRVVIGGEPSPTALPMPLDQFPLVLGTWHGADQPRPDPQTLRVLAADALLDRVYLERGQAPVGLFVAYYGAQQHGEAIHSPQNCLPGSGWQPVSRRRAVIETSGGPIDANRYVIEKQGRQQLVLYWFQGRGRTVSSEYANKFHLVLDAMRLGRTDGSLVRITTPIIAGERVADEVATRFARQSGHALRRWLP